MYFAVQSESEQPPRGFDPSKIRAGQQGKLPVYKFLDGAERELGSRVLTTPEFHSEISQWWANHGDANFPFTGKSQLHRVLLLRRVQGELWLS